MLFLKNVFDDDKLIAAFFFICLLSLLMCSMTLININNKIKSERIIPQNYDNVNKIDCLSSQLKCYRENTDLDEKETITKCREIDFCFVNSK
jgi:hypothetical protein